MSINNRILEVDMSRFKYIIGLVEGFGSEWYKLFCVYNIIVGNCLGVYCYNLSERFLGVKLNYV